MKRLWSGIDQSAESFGDSGYIGVHYTNAEECVRILGPKAEKKQVEEGFDKGKDFYIEMADGRRPFYITFHQKVEEEIRSSK